VTRIDELQRRLQSAFAATDAAPSAAGAAGAARGDTLAQAIVDIAAHYGETARPEALVAGLPLVAGRLPVEHVAAAAERAQLSAELTRESPDALADWSLPAISLTAEGGADILWSVERDGAGAPVAFMVSEPGRAGLKARVVAAEVAAAASGLIVRLAPLAAETHHAGTIAPGGELDWIRSAFAGSRRIYAEAIAATFAINVLALAMPLFTMNVYDRVLPNAAAETLWALSLGVIAATLFDLLIKVLRSTFVDAASRRADVLMANHVYSRVVGARLASRASAVGVRANTLRELETIREFLNSATLTTFGDLPFALLFIAIIGVVAGPLVIVAILAVPVILGAGWLTQRSMSRLAERNVRQVAQRNGVAVETLAGMETIKAAGAESWAASQWERAVAEGIRTSTDLRHHSNIGLYVIYALQTLAQVAMVVVGFYMVAGGSITSGALIAATMLAGRAVQPLSQLAALVARLHQTRIALRLLGELVAAPQERAAGVRFLTPARFAGSLTFEHVGFAYDKDAPPALADVSFEIKAGERVAIVGAIGTGKSSALKLMQALMQPQQGRVLVDGMPVAQVDPALLRRAVRLSLQDADLFHGTIRSNITLADPGAGDDAVMRAAEAAGALSWIARLPRGFDTEVRERGAGLSGGQRQSVALARALLGSPRVLLLDEPTSDMDQRTEALVVERLRASLGDKTFVLVTHRPALIDLVDRLIVLDGGKKLLDGPKASVIAALSQMEKRTQPAARQAGDRSGGT
jgi:ATP-binding cassette subfamily C protein LapB